jgi:5-(carboxyamino)imidazole ribonucleotide synthase
MPLARRTTKGPILPGATIGILGGGQLGRMLAMSARSLGYHVQALDPDTSCAARFVVDRCLAAQFDDDFAAADLARQCDVVTLEIEKISAKSLDACARYAPVRPGRTVLEIVQDRARQKDWLSKLGVPVGAYGHARSAEELANVVALLGGDCFVKSTTGGYDGRGQARVRPGDDCALAWRELGEGPCVVEQAVSIAEELSVLVARRPSGETVVYAPSLNIHENRVLVWSVIPGPLEASLESQAVAIARAIADAIEIEGLLVVELFLTTDGRLLVNELAPRPHNTFHHTEAACVTSQFEQGVRAVCDLPLGSAEIVRPAALCNLFGDLWLGPQAPRWDQALALPGVRLHLYGKRVAKPGRKMGHLTAVGATPEEAMARVREARARLGT